MDQKNSTRPFKLLFFLLFSLMLAPSGLRAQSISNVEIIGIEGSVCQGSTLEVSFYLTGGVFFQFTPSTEYTIKLINASEQVIEEHTFRTSVSTDYSSWIWPVNNRGSLSIPNNIPGGKYYISVSSKKPDAAAATSSEFTIAEPVVPEASVVYPTCIGKPIQLLASSIPLASYRWTGPNNFYSEEQNPWIENISKAIVGTYKVTASLNSCESKEVTVDVNPYPKPEGEEEMGEDYWIGHIYDGIGFDPDLYIGSYQEPEEFDQNFGGQENCFGLSNGNSIFPETFSVRYRMKSSRKGVYAVTLASDDGGRLFVDGKKVYDSWRDQSYPDTEETILLELTGNSILHYEYYENRVDNRVHFGSPILIIQNELLENTDQQLCSGDTAKEISGDRFGRLPEGISAEGTGYQWFYSTSAEGAGIPIAGATGSTFTPNIAREPFNAPGTYYIYREFRILTNEGGTGLRHRSNVARLQVTVPQVNNEISLVNLEDLSGTVTASAANNSTFRISVPEASVIYKIDSAYFGNGVCNLGADAQSIVENLILEQNLTEFPVNQETFPYGILGWCEILGKFSLTVTASYKPAPDIDSEAKGLYIRGSIPGGAEDTYTYLWESSTTGPEGEFSPAPGINNQKNYEVGEPNFTTWYKRIVYSGGCEVSSNIILIEVANNLWTGKEDSNWHNANNWSLNLVPTIDSDAVIPIVETNYPIVNSDFAQARNIQMAEGASLTIQHQMLTLSGYFSSTGEIIAENGSIAFLSTQPQEIPQDVFKNNRIENLLIHNPSGVTSTGKLEITGLLKLQLGNLYLKDSLILISDARKTALIDGSGDGQVIGPVTLQRYLDPAYGYKYISAPVKGLTVDSFTPYLDPVGQNGFAHFYRYEEGRTKDTLGDVTGWVAYTEGALNPMEGYAVNFGENNEAVTISLTGEVNSGPFSRKLNNSKGTFTRGFNLVGNPYPSPIDWDADNGWTKTGIDDAIYFFTASDSDPYTGKYSSYVNGVSSEDGRSSKIIPSMQGFFVHVSDASTAGTLAMDNRVRVIDFEQAFLKSAEKTAPALIRISAGFENETIKDPMVVYFHRQASSAFDADLDALKMMNTHPAAPNLYSFSSERKELSINAIPEFVSEEVIRLPLGLQVERSGDIVFTLQQFDNALAGYYLYLVDLKRKVSKEFDLLNSYSVSLGKGTHNSRFELVLSKSRITIPAVLTKEYFSVRPEGKNIVVQLNPQIAREGEILISSLSGQTLKTQKFKNQKEVIINGIRSAGVYIISVKTGETLTSKKILIN